MYCKWMPSVSFFNIIIINYFDYNVNGHFAWLNLIDNSQNIESTALGHDLIVLFVHWYKDGMVKFFFNNTYY